MQHNNASEPSIETPRLSLVPMIPVVLEPLLAGDGSAAARLLGCEIPVELPLKDMPLARRLKQLRADPTEQPWLVRAMIERTSATMIGHIGFHSRPCPEDLAEIAPDGAELGYSVHAPYRRRGYAKEAAIALMNWAYHQHNQRCFVLSISPENLPSNAMAQSLGFTTKCGSKIDDIDGLEIFFLRRFERWPVDWG